MSKPRAFLFVIAAAVVIEVAGRFRELLMNFHFVARFALLADVIDDRLNLLVGNQHALSPD